MVNMEAVKLAKDLIKEQIGTLEDLPKELAGTIANAHYTFCVKLLEIMGVPEKRTLVPMSVKRRAREFGVLFGKVLSEEGQIVKDLQATIENVKALKGAGKEPNLEKHDPTVDLILNSLKTNVLGMIGAQHPR